MRRVEALRDRLWSGLKGHFGGGLIWNADPDHCLPNTLNVSFVGRVGADILQRVAGIAASTGSACHAGTIELSPVLKAMDVAPEVGMGAVRFSLGRTTTERDIETAIDLLAASVTPAAWRRSPASAQSPRP